MCGEECPELCRVCNPERFDPDSENAVNTIFFGTEDDPDARFIQLKDCGHFVEVWYLEIYLK
jgi:hypothetical protein